MFYLPPDATAVPAHARTVEASDCYKALRGAELAAYRDVLRALSMRAPSRRGARALEELRELFDISDERHEAEVTIAEADAMVRTVRSSAVASRRADFADPLHDIVPPEPAPLEEDDGGRIAAVIPAAPRPAVAVGVDAIAVGAKRSSKPAGGSGQAQAAPPQPAPVPPSKAAATSRAGRPATPAGSTTHAGQAEAAFRQRLAALAEQIQATATKRLRSRDDQERVGLKLALMDLDKQLEALGKEALEAGLP